ncbi:GAF sensor signal transduction histidine kinase [Calothrix parasitica NIES-267]|uniref:histidine kinase n=1 Tax=Calothrix parasitica NIES-267 TaxID=1973488 RepID=A0A1Z4LN70_9CYAN|nr:GAF sensor signal transduction histidine kinase [Calothrix parasitica NIES-267]
MTNEKRLEIGLFVMRLSIGIFFLALIIQKFLAYRPTTGDFTGFYSIETSIFFYPVLFTATALIIIFLSGLCKTFSYGIFLGLQLVFLGSMHNEMLQPQQPNYVLFWTGIPIIGALITLFLLRNKDIFLSFSRKSNDNLNYQNCYWQHKQRTLEILSHLSHRTGEFKVYLQQIANGVSELIEIDSSVITICQEDFAQILASNIQLKEDNNHVSLHGQLTGTVFNSGKCLVVEDTINSTEYGQAPEGCRAYLGIPLRTSQGKVIGTICCFHGKPRKFSAQEIEIIELFAERAATAIDNHHLYQQQKEFNQTLEAEVTKKTQELKTAQAQLVKQERLAAIGEFAASIVHEIRNPFCTIKLVLEYFNKVDLSAEVQKRLNLAVDEAKRLEKLLEEILLYAKPHILDISLIDMNQCIEKMLNIQLDLPQFANKNIEFNPAISKPLIQGDEDKIKQVLINLIQNACEAIAPGEEVELEVDSNFDKEEVSIQVRNGGEPIPPDILPLLTQPFYSTKSSGTGLGLAITKRIVEAHNGEFMIESNPEQGTSVTVKLPLAIG